MFVLANPALFHQGCSFLVRNRFEVHSKPRFLSKFFIFHSRSKFFPTFFKMALLHRIFLVFLLDVSYSSRILFVPAHTFPSHTKSMYPAAEALKRNGHEVFMLQIIENVNQRCENPGVIDLIISISNQTDESSADFLSKLIWSKHATQPIGFVFPWKATTDACVKLFAETSTRKNFEAILDQHWDAVVIDNLFAPCGILIAKNFSDRVIIDFGTTTLLHTSYRIRGIFTPTSVFASYRELIYGIADFSYRLWTTLDVLQHDFILHSLHYLIPYWGIDGINVELLPELSTLSVTSLPNGLDFVQSVSRDIIDLDVACPRNSSLPDRLAAFVDDPRSRGTILFALGHYGDWTHSPPGTVEAFAEAFASLPQYRIIWQFSSKLARRNVSSNVLVESWIPQTAVLNHWKTKVFISHVGYKSLRETICAGVPIVAMPLFAEQYRNAAMARHRGFAMVLDKMNLSALIIRRALQTILDDQRYDVAIKRTQRQLSDKVRDPMDLFNFQFDFLTRHFDKNVMDKYVKTKFSRLPTLASWWQAEAVLIFVLCLLIFFCLIN